MDDNIATTLVALQPSPALADVSVRINPYPGTPPTLGPGNEPYAQVTVTNRGPGQALRVMVEYRLPPEGRFKVSIPARREVAMWGSRVRRRHRTRRLTNPFVLIPGPPGAPMEFCIPRLMPGESRSFAVSVVVPAGSMWTASAKAATPDPDPKNNFAVADAAGRSCGCVQPIGPPPWQP
jgi:hypothetical protein